METVENENEHKNDNKNKNEQEIEYTYADKIALKTKLEKIKDKTYLLHIYNILKDDDVKCSLNNNGLFTFFHNLKNSTYQKLDKYVEYIYNKNTQSRIVKITKEYVQNDDKIITDYDFLNDLKSDMFDSLSNREKKMMRKKIYDEQLENMKE